MEGWIKLSVVLSHIPVIDEFLPLEERLEYSVNHLFFVIINLFLRNSLSMQT